VSVDSTAPSSATPSPALSVILCTLNGRATIRKQLEALAGQMTDRRFEVIVVDNGSTDDTTAVINSFGELQGRLRIVPAHERKNLSYARNVGVKAASAEFVAFCDDDDVVGYTWVDGLLEALEAGPYVASAMEYDRLNSPARLRGRARFQSQQVEEMFGIPVTNGAIAIARTLWLEIGGNDEDFGTTGEDFDFAMRFFEETGIRPTMADRAVYHYLLRSGGRSSFRQARRYGESHAQLYARHGRGRVDVKANTRDAARDWWWIASRAPLALLGKRRENWATHAGRRLGRLVGSVSYRVLWL
jgi:glycosyltransferase involved in cell wall biosynthesis